MAAHNRHPTYAALSVNELVHAARAKGGAHGLNDGLAGVDVADKLSDTLACVGAIPQKDDLGALRTTHNHGRATNADSTVSVATRAHNHDSDTA